MQVPGATVAGKYRIVRVLGKGAMGVVYEARHLGLGKRVAVKVIASHLGASEDAARRFRREARATGAIESEHVAQVFDAGQDPEHGLFMVLEYLPGEDLEARLRREKKLAPKVAVEIATQVGRALVKAHAAGIVHRDLKPANVFLVEHEDGGIHVKVLDFGISKLLEPELDKSGAVLTQVGMAVGSPMYASPEQAQGLANVDARTDVWSLGAVLYEMLAGRPAYLETKSYEAFIRRLVAGPPDPLDVVAPWVPQALSAIVHAAVRPDVATRVPSAAIFVNLLSRALAPSPSSEDERTQPDAHAAVADAGADAATLAAAAEPPMEDDGTIVMAAPPANMRPKQKSVPPRPTPSRRPPAPIPPAPATMPTPPPVVIDSGEWPTSVAVSPSIAAKAEEPPKLVKPAKKAPPPPPPADMGGILVAPPRPRAPMPTIPSMERVARRRARARVLVLSIGLAALLAAAFVVWVLLGRPR